jgi:hypothetical protein
LLEVFDQSLTTGVNQNSILAGVISELGVDAVYAILDRRVRAWNAKCGVKALRIATEEILHDLL